MPRRLASRERWEAAFGALIAGPPPEAELRRAAAGPGLVMMPPSASSNNRNNGTSNAAGGPKDAGGPLAIPLAQHLELTSGTVDPRDRTMSPESMVGDSSIVVNGGDGVLSSTASPNMTAVEFENSLPRLAALAAALVTSTTADADDDGHQRPSTAAPPEGAHDAAGAAHATDGKEGTGSTAAAAPSGENTMTSAGNTTAGNKAEHDDDDDDIPILEADPPGAWWAAQLRKPPTRDHAALFTVTLPSPSNNNNNAAAGAAIDSPPSTGRDMTAPGSPSMITAPASPGTSPAQLTTTISAFASQPTVYPSLMTSGNMPALGSLPPAMMMSSSSQPSLLNSPRLLASPRGGALQASDSSNAFSQATGSTVPGGATSAASPDNATSTDVIAAGLAAPTRPKAFRIRNRTMRAFVSDPDFLRLVESDQPACAVIPGGLAAVDVVQQTIRHVRKTYAARLTATRQWLDESHFQVVMANSDGTPDDDFRVVLTGDRPVDNEYVLVVPRPEFAAIAFVPRMPAGHHEADLRAAVGGAAAIPAPFVAELPADNSRFRPVRGGTFTFDVEVTHDASPADGDLPVTEGSAAEITPGGRSRRLYTATILVDLFVRQLPEELCKQLFLAGTSEPRTPVGGRGDPVVPEEDTFALVYNGVPINLLQNGNFRLDGGAAGSGGVALQHMTVKQAVDAGIHTLQFTTYHAAPNRLRIDQKSIAGSSFESIPSGGSRGSSFVPQGNGGEAKAAASAAAELWRVTHMDDIEALAYQSYHVRKRNERKVWQHRLFSVDKDFVYNQLEEEQHGATKRPMRRIVDIESITVSSDDPRQCVLTYQRGPNAITSGVFRDELEFRTPHECKHFATKLRILQRLAQQSATAPVTVNSASSPNHGPKRSVSERFLNLFR